MSDIPEIDKTTGCTDLEFGCDATYGDTLNAQVSPAGVSITCNGVCGSNTIILSNADAQLLAETLLARLKEQAA